MLNRFFGIVLGHVAIGVVVVRFTGPVQQGMCRFFGLAESNRLAGDDTHLPEGKNQGDKHGEPAKHAASLASVFSCCPRFPGSS